MPELSSIRLIGETPNRGSIPSLGGPKLPRPTWRGGRDNLLTLLDYLAGVAPLVKAARAQRTGPFDLRAESIDLTIEHTIARIYRGAA